MHFVVLGARKAFIIAAHRGENLPVIGGKGQGAHLLPALLPPEIRRAAAESGVIGGHQHLLPVAVLLQNAHDFAAADLFAFSLKRHVLFNKVLRYSGMRVHPEDHLPRCMRKRDIPPAGKRSFLVFEHFDLVERPVFPRKPVHNLPRLVRGRAVYQNDLDPFVWIGLPFQILEQVVQGLFRIPRDHYKRKRHLFTHTLHYLPYLSSISHYSSIVRIIH